MNLPWCRNTYINVQPIYLLRLSIFSKEAKNPCFMLHPPIFKCWQLPRFSVTLCRLNKASLLVAPGLGCPLCTSAPQPSPTAFTHSHRADSPVITTVTPSSRAPTHMHAVLLLTFSGHRDSRHHHPHPPAQHFLSKHFESASLKVPSLFTPMESE